MTPRTPWPLTAARLTMIAVLCAGPAFAAEAPADAPTATAPAGPGVADQIAAYLRDSPVVRLPAGETARGATDATPRRRPHGVVEVAVGSHGYRSVYVRSDLPIGETGTLSIAVGETRGGRGFHGLDGPVDLRAPGCRDRADVDADRRCLSSPGVIEPLDGLDRRRSLEPGR